MKFFFYKFSSKFLLQHNFQTFLRFISGNVVLHGNFIIFWVWSIIVKSQISVWHIQRRLACKCSVYHLKYRAEIFSGIYFYRFFHILYFISFIYKTFCGRVNGSWKQHIFFIQRNFCNIYGFIGLKIQIFDYYISALIRRFISCKFIYSDRKSVV